jgi:SAM-dependent methyltransferase
MSGNGAQPVGGTAFAFGRNWRRFLAGGLSAERLQEAKISLTTFLGRESLAGLTFVDVGCGSGLFSLAACELGARAVVSFDIDPEAVACCRMLRERTGGPAYWRVESGSVLDPVFLTQLGQFDVVYSWGVLHHTGQMWQAVANAASLVKPGGLFYLAVYNRAEDFAFYRDGRFGPSRFWLWEKRLYVALPGLLQAAVDGAVMALLVTGYLLTGRNPVRQIRQHVRRRGMSWRVDIRDWLGGYPYEFAAVDEVFAFAKGQGFALERLKYHGGLLNNEYLFVRTSAGLPATEGAAGVTRQS